MKIAEGGLSWIFASFLITFLLIVLAFFVKSQWRFLVIFIFIIFLLKSFVLLVFFRDPKREIGESIVAVADGVIREITNLEDKDVGDCTRITTFMNIHNVHVNRMPYDGEIRDITHYKGAHIPAFKKESDKNERVVLLIDTNIGIVKIVQIAGTMARRIVPYIKKGEKVKKGEKIGIIRLGSRVDIYLSKKKIKSINVKLRDKVKAGEDTIAEIND